VYTAPRSPQSIGGVLDSTITLFKASFRHCWLAALLYSIVSLVLTVWIQQRLLSTAAAMGSDPTPMEALGAMADPAIWGGYLLVMLFSIFINLVMSATIIDIARGREGRGALAHFGSTLPLLPGAIGLALAIFLGVIVVGMVVAIFVGALSLGAAATGGAGAALGVMVMCIVIAVPCLYLGVRWILWSAAYTDRREGAFAAMGTSWNLVDGNWWRTLVIVSVVGIVITIMVVLLGVVAGYFAAASGEDSFAQILVSAVLQSALQVLYLPALSACFVATYMDLQLRKGGGDLEARLGSLGSQA
jgi:hypothetical protein